MPMPLVESCRVHDQPHGRTRHLVRRALCIRSTRRSTSSSSTRMKTIAWYRSWRPPLGAFDIRTMFERHALGDCPRAAQCRAEARESASDRLPGRRLLSIQHGSCGKGVDLLAESRRGLCRWSPPRTSSAETINGRFHARHLGRPKGTSGQPRSSGLAFFRKGSRSSLSEDTTRTSASDPRRLGAPMRVRISLLRLLAAGYATYYDPALYGFHAKLKAAAATAAGLEKSRSYGRGLRARAEAARLRHDRPGLLASTYRAGGCVVCVLQESAGEARYYANVLLWATSMGWIGRRLNVGI